MSRDDDDAGGTGGGSADGGGPATPATPAPRARARERLDSGLSLYREAEYGDALAEIDSALVLDPRWAEAHKARGDALRELFRYQEAVAAYAAAVDETNEAEEPATRAEAYFERGEALYTLRRFVEAAESYRNGGRLFDGLAREADARNEYPEGYKHRARSGDVYNSLGFTLFALKRYDKALLQFNAAIVRARKYPYAFHSLASVLWAQGRYAEAREQWGEARGRYDNDTMMEEAERESWWGTFTNFANLMHEVYGDLDRAEKMYRVALRMYEKSVMARLGLLNLYIERASSPACRAEAYCNARKVYEEAKAILSERLSGAEDLDSMIMFGELGIAWNDYDGSGRWREGEGKKAEEWLTKALDKDKADGKNAGYTRTAKPAASLGVIHARRRDYKKAIAFFEQALMLENDDLALRSNLAEAYLRDKQFDEAEREYGFVVAMAPGHVESLIGLGELYLARGEAGDPDMYEQATESFAAALRHGEGQRGSKRLKAKEQAKVHYLRAYAMVKSFEGSKLLRDQDLLWRARDEFKACSRHDPEHFHARRAVAKIEKSLGTRTPQRLLERYVPLLAFFAAAVPFGFAQWKFFWQADKEFGAAAYTTLTFGLLALMVVSAYLPQVLKLKFGGLEMEKSNVNQVATLGTLGITSATTKGN